MADPIGSVRIAQLYGCQMPVQLAGLLHSLGNGKQEARDAPQVLTHGVGKGPTVLQRKWALSPDGMNIQNPPWALRKNLTGLVAVALWSTPGDRDLRFGGLEDPRRPFQMRIYKTSPAYALSKTIRGITKDSAGTPIGFCKVLVFRTSDNLLIARTVSAADGSYSVTVPS